MDVQTFLKKLKLQVPENVRATAQQYERLLAMKSAAKRSKDVLSRPAVCVELACLGNNESFPRAQALALCGIRAKEYEEAMQTTRKVLNLTTGVTAASLCAKYGTDDLRNMCEDAQKKFLRLYTQQFPTCPDVDHPRFACVIYYLCCVANKTRVGKEKLLKDASVSKAQFDELVRTASQLMPELAPPARTPGKSRAKASSKDAGEGEEEGEEEEEEEEGDKADGKDGSEAAKAPTTTAEKGRRTPSSAAPTPRSRATPRTPGTISRRKDILKRMADTPPVGEKAESNKRQAREVVEPYPEWKARMLEIARAKIAAA